MRLLLYIAIFLPLLTSARDSIPQYPSGHARLDLLASGGYQYPLKGLGSIHGDHYRFTKKKWAGLLIGCAGGFVDGFVEGYEFDGRTHFEQVYGVDPYSFFGSLSWDSEWTWLERAKYSQTDFYHTADDARKWLYLEAGWQMGRASYVNKRRFHNWVDRGILIIGSGLWKSFGMQVARRQIDWNGIF